MRTVHRERAAHWASIASVFFHVHDAHKAHGALGMRAAHRALRPENFNPSSKFASNHFIFLQVSHPSLLINSWLCYGVSNEEKISVLYGEI